MNLKFILPEGTLLRGRHTYRIERVLGRGGFGITYLASFELYVDNIPVTVRVAIKEHFASEYNERGSDGVTVTTPGTAHARKMAAESLKDFTSEAQRLSRLSNSHPNIVKVNEVFEANNTSYYVMEYLEGYSLRDYVARKGALSQSRMLLLLKPVIDALAFLHRNRITHLDVKPANIMLTSGKNGGLRPVLIDFGLSKHYDENGEPTSTLKTPAYTIGFAPAEQYVGLSRFSPEADVYAMGATMLFAASGKVPYDAWSPPEGEPEQSLAATNLDVPMQAIIAKAMRHKAKDRYPSAVELQDAIAKKPADPFSTIYPKPQSPSKAPEPREAKRVAATPSGEKPTEKDAGMAQKKNRNRLYIVIGIAIGVLIALGLYLGTRSDGSDRDTEPVTPPTEEPSDSTKRAEAEAARIADSIKQARAAEDVRKAREADSIRRAREADAARKADSIRRADEAAKRKADSLKKVREAEAAETAKWNKYMSPSNYALAVTRKGQKYYLTQDQWRALSAAERNECTRRGLVINTGGLRFVLSLTDAATGADWNQASRYHAQLPDKAQANFIARNFGAINKALRAYGGTALSGDYMSRATYSGSNNIIFGIIIPDGVVETFEKTEKLRVRTVSAI